MATHDFEQIQARVGELLVNRLRRNILRRMCGRCGVTTEMELVVDAGGDVRCIYDRPLDLCELGKSQITRASHVEPGPDGYYWTDMGLLLGPFSGRTETPAVERAWLRHRKACVATGTSGHATRPIES